MPDIELTDVTELTVEAQEADADRDVPVDLDAPLDLETPEADGAEQRRDVLAGAPTDEPTEVPPEVDPADLQEQLRVVELDDDGYDR